MIFIKKTQEIDRINQWKKVVKSSLKKKNYLIAFKEGDKMGFLEEAKKMQEEAEANRIEEKSNTELIEQLNRGNNIRDKKVQQNELIEELYRRAIENIKISEWERMKINKNDFSDKDEIIDILLYSLGKMAQDPMFYKLNVQKLKGHNPIYEKEAEQIFSIPFYNTNTFIIFLTNF